MVDGLLAADLFIYVDNERPVGPTKTLCWDACIRWGLTCSWLVLRMTTERYNLHHRFQGYGMVLLIISMEVCTCKLSKDIRDKNSRLI